MKAAGVRAAPESGGAFQHQGLDVVQPLDLGCRAIHCGVLCSGTHGEHQALWAVQIQDELHCHPAGAVPIHHGGHLHGVLRLCAPYRQREKQQTQNRQ